MVQSLYEFKKVMCLCVIGNSPGKTDLEVGSPVSTSVQWF